MAKKKNNSDKEKDEQRKSKGKKPTTKKKRKRGRPKKRGRKKKYYKPKKKRKSTQSRKGFGSNVSYNRVRSLLWKEFKNDFASYRDFISNDVDANGNKIKGTSIVSQVYSQCKDIECSDDDILSIYSQFKAQDKEGGVPLVPEQYFFADDNPYWTLLTENIWDGFDDRVWIYSPMLLNEPPYFLAILGEDRCIDKKTNQIADINKCDDKENYKYVRGNKWRFQAFVDYCNELQRLYQDEMDSMTVPHFKLQGKEGNEFEPYWNDEMNRWEVELVPCEPDGTPNDYGFDPTLLAPEIPDDFTLPEPSEPQPPSEPEEPAPETAQIEKQIELEKEKQKTIEKQIEADKVRAKTKILDLFAQGKIDKDEMMLLLDATQK